MSILAHVMRGAGRGDPGALGRGSAVTCGPAAPVGCAPSCAGWWLASQDERETRAFPGAGSPSYPPAPTDARGNFAESGIQLPPPNPQVEEKVIH